MVFRDFREKKCWFIIPVKLYFYWPILATRVYEEEVYYVTRMKNRKQLNIL